MSIGKHILKIRIQVFAKLHIRGRKGYYRLFNQKGQLESLAFIRQKEMGRKIVFCLGITERNLKKFFKKNIKYESLLYVSVTRAIYKNYFGLEEKNDD